MKRYIDTKEIAELAETTNLNKARMIKNRANEICKNRGFIVPSERKAPRDIVLELLGISQKEE